MSTPRRQSPLIVMGRRLMLTSAILLVIGLGDVVYRGFTETTKMVDSTLLATSPGETAVQLSHAGWYSILVPAELGEEVTVRLENSAGLPFPLNHIEDATPRWMQSLMGVSRYEIEIIEPGLYDLSVEGPEGLVRVNYAHQLRIHGLLLFLMQTLVSYVAVATVAMVVGSILVRTGTNRDKKRAAAASTG